MKQWDAIVIGAGIIGLSLAIELNKRGLRVLIIDKGGPGREASWAAGGMLADFPLEMPACVTGSGYGWRGACIPSLCTNWKMSRA